MNKEELYEMYEEKFAELTPESSSKIRVVNETYKKIMDILNKIENEELVSEIKNLLDTYSESFSEYHAVREEELFYKTYDLLKK